VAPFSLQESAGRVARYRWVEDRLFEILGGWVPTVAEPEAKLLLATQAPRHAWHAGLWRERLPVASGLPSVAGGAPSDEWAAVLEAVSGLSGSVERLVGAYRVVVPRLVTAYRWHLGRAEPVSDAPVIRVLQLVLADEEAGWQEGEEAVQSLLGTADEVRRAAACQGRLEALVVAAGGLTGPVGGLEGTRWPP